MHHPHFKVPAIPPGTKTELVELEHKIIQARGRVSPLYQVLLHSQPLTIGWESLLTAIRQKSSLPDDLRELLILRVAVLNKAQFEFDAHAPIALEAGVSNEKIEALKQEDLAEIFTTEERLALHVCDHMTNDVHVPAHYMHSLAELYNHQFIVELIATIAAYNMVSRFLVACGIH